VLTQNKSDSVSWKKLTLYSGIWNNQYYIFTW